MLCSIYITVICKVTVTITEHCLAGRVALSFIALMSALPDILAWQSEAKFLTQNLSCLKRLQANLERKINEEYHLANQKIPIVVGFFWCVGMGQFIQDLADQRFWSRF